LLRLVCVGPPHIIPRRASATAGMLAARPPRLGPACQRQTRCRPMDEARRVATNIPEIEARTLKLHIATPMARWAVMLIRKKRENLGVVDAPDEYAVIAKVAQIHNIPRAPEPIVVTKPDAKR
jgi:hypothetical protein